MRDGYQSLGLMLASACLAGLTAHLARAAAPNGFEIGIEPSYFSGNFGTTRPIHIYYLPVDLQYRDGPASIRVSIPYISVTGQGIVSGGAVIGGGGPSGRRSGLGDIWLTAKYRFQTINGAIPNIVPYFKLKVPTASRRQGLGTGHPDEEIGSFFQWRIGSRIFPFAQLGYRFVGKSRTLKLRSVPTYEFGATFVLAPTHYLTLLATGHPSIQRGFGPSEDLDFITAYNTFLTRKIGMQIFADKGLTNRSAAFGFGAGLTMHF